ncbi:MAG TPA: nuclear transport factor 2 family protein [Yinghuangia sp.]|uniref:nuclear transport factor 2 family protein n=1 Tax=Yinghuangia sp. YIM S10712 TaxID=3436930 RepID=UPI002C83A196|nr:nuclear transport factor 2 family protein [Yinghuangia sp.]
MSTDASIADRIEIADLFTRLGRLLDDKRWDDAGSVFAEDVASHSPRSGEIRGIDQLVAFMRRAEVEGEHTQHLAVDLLVNVDGDQATASANSLVYFYREGQAPHQTSGLRLTATVVRTPAGWRFREYEVAPAWIAKN